MRFLLFYLLFCLAAPFASAAERPPNILLILADDLGWHDVGFNGRKEWKTPNLDRLAREGTTFRRWYTGGVTCAPSRAVLMTGKYTIHNGVVENNDDLPSEEITLPEALRTKGYTTALFGKWHHGRPRAGKTTYVHPLDHGFHEFYGFTDAVHAWQHFPTNLWHGRELRPVRGYTATLFANRSIDFIRRHRDTPFFLYLPFTEPHFHVEAPAGDLEEFRGKFEERAPADPRNAAYAAMVTRLDAEVGRVLRALDDAGLRDNTLVIFASDHGATFEPGNKGASNYHDSNHPFRGHKRTLWEGGIRVPGVVRWPGQVPAGKLSDDVVHMMDVFPTVLAACGGTASPDWRLTGTNLLQVWKGAAKSPERTLFWEWRSEGYRQLAAMAGDRKMIVTGTTPSELYDVAKDPGERRNIAAEFPEIDKELERQVYAWLATETRVDRLGGAAPGGPRR